MMVGGNIRYQTRVLTTAIVLETSKGEFAVAIRLGLSSAGHHLPREPGPDLDPAARGTALSALIQVRGLARPAERETSFWRSSHSTCNAGRCWRLVGPNGAGKTTLLLALAGLLGTAGRRDRLSRPPTARNGIRSSIAAGCRSCFKLPLLLDMSVADNVALGLRFRGVPREQVSERVRTWLERLGIALARSTSRRWNFPAAKPKGSAWRGRLYWNPNCCSWMNPFLRLDPPARQKLLRGSERSAAQDHKTAVFVTHNLHEAARLSDRVAVVLGGKLRQMAAATQIKARPGRQAGRRLLADDAALTLFNGLPRDRSRGSQDQLRGRRESLTSGTSVKPAKSLRLAGGQDSCRTKRSRACPFRCRPGHWSIAGQSLALADRAATRPDKQAPPPARFRAPHARSTLSC